MPNKHDVNALKTFAANREAENEELKGKLLQYEAMLFEMKARLAVYERMNKLRSDALAGGYWAKFKYAVAARLLRGK